MCPTPSLTSTLWASIYCDSTLSMAPVLSKSICRGEVSLHPARTGTHSAGEPGRLLATGVKQVCAGYALCGSSTMLALTLGHGVKGLTLERGWRAHPHSPQDDDPGKHAGICQQSLQPPLLGTAGAALRAGMTARQEGIVRHGLQHALGGEHGDRGTSRPHLRRSLGVPARHQRRQQIRQAALAVPG